MLTNACKKIHALSNTKEFQWRDVWTKFTFLAFCWLSLVLYCVAGATAYYLITLRLVSLAVWLDWTIAALLVCGALLLFMGLLEITFTALTGNSLLYPHKSRLLTIKILFPVAVILSQLVGVNRNVLRTSFVKVNNALTKAQKKYIKGERIMILLPHCLQIDICSRKLTTDVNNCVRCGRCPVGALLTMGDNLGLKLDVANGGTLARKKVASFRPDGIVAVACERDLTSGILDTYPIPVYGVLNDRPNGPCVNTCVDLKLVEEGIAFFRKDRQNANAA